MGHNIPQIRRLFPCCITGVTFGNGSVGRSLVGVTEGLAVFVGFGVSVGLGVGVFVAVGLAVWIGGVGATLT